MAAYCNETLAPNETLRLAEGGRRRMTAARRSEGPSRARGEDDTPLAPRVCEECARGGMLRIRQHFARRSFFDDFPLG